MMLADSIKTTASYSLRLQILTILGRDICYIILKISNLEEFFIKTPRWLRDKTMLKIFLFLLILVCVSSESEVEKNCLVLAQETCAKEYKNYVNDHDNCWVYQDFIQCFRKSTDPKCYSIFSKSHECFTERATKVYKEKKSRSNSKRNEMTIQRMFLLGVVVTSLCY
ncbi:uncharacterized protein LOC128249925 isoform X1 [Octopus bimaculoides]|uniref:uncharacterized protein LOC128249925 isoform X1 n=1 Tax=Octopus bimaculoides TaxID=37653 RepID=UPI0022E370EB|nr:uncharacterized protein LOC128249925 isoform X1 [Octopus bimaculoides]